MTNSKDEKEALHATDRGYEIKIVNGKGQLRNLLSFPALFSLSCITVFCVGDDLFLMD